MLITDYDDDDTTHLLLSQYYFILVFPILNDDSLNLKGFHTFTRYFCVVIC